MAAVNYRNRLGLIITVENISVMHTRVTVDGKSLDMRVGTDRLNRGIASWITGAYLQDALPFLTADEREFLLTGTVPGDWDAMFPDEGPPAGVGEHGYTSDDVCEHGYPKHLNCRGCNPDEPGR